MGTRSLKDDKEFLVCDYYAPEQAKETYDRLAGEASAGL
jgi:hypothetical protein